MAGFAVLALVSIELGTAHATFPEGKEKIAFQRGEAIWAMNADGTAQRRLGCPGGGSPAWSPDGQRIAFERGVFEDRDYFMSTFVMDADGGGETPIKQVDLSWGVGGEAGAPAWSPDGQRIAFHTGAARLHYPALGVMNADGSDWTRLADEGSSPAWSPDGERIAFGVWGDIWVMDQDGSNQRPLTDGRSSDGGPAWSPDGERIAFERRPSIWVMDQDGSNQRRLTDGPSSDGGPAWSPDGERIAFARDGDIWTMNADGTGQVRLTESPVREGSPTWQPVPAPIGSRACFTLAASVTGPGWGTVFGGGSIFCGKDKEGYPRNCAATYAQGSDITLRLTRDWGWYFAGWGGACAGTGPSCRVTMNRDRRVSARFTGVPIRVQVRPRQRRVGPNKRRVRYRFVARNVTDRASERINLCARGPQRVRILGSRCVTWRQLPAGAQRQRTVRVRIRPAARGKLTRIRLIARGPSVQNRRTFARLRVRR